MSRHALETISEQSAALLKTADQYDAIADATPRGPDGKPQSVMAKLNTHLKQIASNNPPCKEVVQLVIVYAGIANTMATALFPEKRKKLSESIDALIKAVGDL